jgi:hypothetical protein
MVFDTWSAAGRLIMATIHGWIGSQPFRRGGYAADTGKVMRQEVTRTDPARRLAFSTGLPVVISCVLEEKKPF